ncbi:MAG: nucleotidyltransferase [Eubacteriales bacterium]|nr:nucleotidyltransferase [Eubacteriales bacterium]
MKFTEDNLNAYSQPLSATEDEQCKNAIRMVRDSLKPLGFTDDGKDIALLHSDTYAYSISMRTNDYRRKVKLFVQGSYANNTNVRTQSDVDIAVVQEEVFTTEYRDSSSTYPQSDKDYNFSTAEIPAKSFKDEVQECLVAKFGLDVERKDKSIKVHGNTYRKDADTVPCRRYRDYRKDYSKNESNYIGGIVIHPDKGGRIINYPEQHIANGRAKNNSTNGYYKKFVRIMKKMRYLMEDSNNTSNKEAAVGVSSFMLESLLWNIEDQWYIENGTKYRKVYVFYLLVQKLRASKNSFCSYKEANGIKPLCADDNAYHNLCIFIDSLSSFYEYE